MSYEEMKSADTTDQAFAMVLVVRAENAEAARSRVVDYMPELMVEFIGQPVYVVAGANNSYEHLDQWDFEATE
jgi:hypothetical protein